MDWPTRLNRALDYIEENLDAEIDLKCAAKLAFCSPNGLSSLFLMATGIPLNEYVRRRRLSLAALELQNSDRKIIDIALKYGYSSPRRLTARFRASTRFRPRTPEAARCRSRPTRASRFRSN